jgi:hypothetical protein
MKEITITINECDITGCIFSESGYATLARAKSGMPERLTDIVQATEDDRSVIRRFIAESMNEAAGIITRYMSPCTVRRTGAGDEADAIINIQFAMPHNFATGIIALLKESITSFAAARSLQHWMLMVNPDEASIHLSKAQSDIARMRELLSARTRPVKGGTADDNIIEL